MFRYNSHFICLLFFEKKPPILAGLVGNLKKKTKHFSGLITCFFLLFQSWLLWILKWQGADDKKPKISRIKAKIIYFEASNYGKKVKNLEFLGKSSIFELE